MNRSKEEYTTMVSSSLLECMGGNASSMSGVLLFDNLEGVDPEVVPAEYINAPIKLKSDVIIICMTGWLTLIMDCNNPIKVSNGQIVCFRDGQIVEFIEAHPDCRLILITLPHDLVTSLGAVKEIDYSDETVVLTPDKEHIAELTNLYRMMKRKMDNESLRLRREIIFHYLRIIVLNIAELMALAGTIDSEQVIAASSPQATLYHRFIRLVKDSFTSHRDIDFYASSLCVSPGHLSRIVKSVSGKTAGEWIRDYVILEAKVMLQSSELAVFQISDRLNFPNPSFFSKYFRERVGLTPTDYRKQKI